MNNEVQIVYSSDDSIKTERIRPADYSTQLLMLTALNAIAEALGTVGADATSIIAGRQVVEIEDTPIALGSADCKTIFITALTTNSDVIVVGDENVIYDEATRTGNILYPGDKLTLSISNLDKIFINGKATEGVSFSYLT